MTQRTCGVLLKKRETETKRTEEKVSGPTSLVPSLISRLSPRTNKKSLFCTASDGKLTGGWKGGYLVPLFQASIPDAPPPISPKFLSVEA